MTTRQRRQMAPESTTLARKVRDLENQVRELRAARRLENASLSAGAIKVVDPDGTVRASFGYQDDGTVALTAHTGPTPPAPTAPTVAPALAALTVAWDGIFVTGNTPPADWLRVEVHVSPVEEFTPDQTTLRQTFETPQGGSVTIPLPYEEQWVVLRSLTTSGAYSDPTDAVPGTPRQAEAPDIAAGAITAEQLDADAINGIVITGSTVQTAMSGQRIVLNPGNHATGVPPSLDMYTGASTETLPGQVITEFVGEGHILLSSPQISGGPQAFLGVVGDTTSPRVYMIVDGIEVVVGPETNGMVVTGDMTWGGVAQGRGLVAHLLRTTNVTGLDTDPTAIFTTPSITWKAGRAYRVHMIGLMSTTSSGAYSLYTVVKGTTATGSNIRNQIRIPLIGTANTHAEFSVDLSNSTSADITTAITITGSVSAGGGQFSATSATPATCSVTDLGLASDWPGTPLT